MPLSTDERHFLELLPWYLNRTLPPEQMSWCEQLLASSARARTLLDREQLLADGTAASLEPAAEDVGLARLQARLRSERAPAANPAPRPSAWQAFWQGLATPRAAGWLATAVAVQFLVIGALGVRYQGMYSETRQVAVEQARTLRVQFREGLSETDLRNGLIAAGARIVGGPNQIGEYWLASSLVSLDEMRSSLESSGTITSAVVDVVGPK